jgi:hypothetical protein
VVRVIKAPNKRSQQWRRNFLIGERETRVVLVGGLKVSASRDVGGRATAEKPREDMGVSENEVIEKN